jgi:hypothetical protein
VRAARGTQESTGRRVSHARVVVEDRALRRCRISSWRDFGHRQTVKLPALRQVGFHANRCLLDVQTVMPRDILHRPSHIESAWNVICSACARVIPDCEGTAPGARPMRGPRGTPLTETGYSVRVHSRVSLSRCFTAECGT